MGVFIHNCMFTKPLDFGSSQIKILLSVSVENLETRSKEVALEMAKIAMLFERQTSPQACVGVDGLKILLADMTLEWSSIKDPPPHFDLLKKEFNKIMHNMQAFW